MLRLHLEILIVPDRTLEEALQSKFYIGHQ